MELQALVQIGTQNISKVAVVTEPVKTKSYEQIFLEKTGLNFNKFYKEYNNKLVWQIQKMNINVIDAEDIAHRAFMQALDKIESYKPEFKFSTWLFDIGKKMAYQYKKDEKKREILVDTTSESSDEDNSNYDPVQSYLKTKIDTMQEDFESQHITQLKYQETLKEISNLDPKYRRIIELSDIQGKSYNEICEILNIELQTVKNRLHHGRLKLEKVLKDKFKLIEQNY